MDAKKQETERSIIEKLLFGILMDMECENYTEEGRQEVLDDLEWLVRRLVDMNQKG